MHNQNQPNPLTTAKIIWGALCASMVFYGFVLFFVEKITYVEMVTAPESFYEKLAAVASVLLLVTFYIKNKFIAPQRDFQKRFPLYITCWAMHELIVIMAFLATFLSESGNGFYYVMNLGVALFGNVMLFPKDYRVTI